ncbi:hypothetical protein [Winogradskyella haliclonae]|uniref:Lipoprotein n=1 Tax=Winogradskyella haliclonae TaxID=2048558 RepID=A0ABQ2C2M3_9FLAO|nr:hypothetical protein [Winogradskyella haliclonae]GGI58490.1 hypothetical protein GCM10011444_27990 [Winogradskyella haliclonae]
MKRKSLITIFIILTLAFFCFKAIKLFGSLTDKKINYEVPEDHKSLFVDSLEIKHYSSISDKELNTISSHLYENNSFGIIVFKRAFIQNDIISKISIINERKNEDKGRVYTGSIFTDGFGYSFEDRGDLNNINIYIENFDKSFLIEQTDEKLYLSFILNKNLSIEYNNSGEIDLNTKKQLFNSNGYNELMILKRNNYLYFIYLRPFKEGLKGHLLLDKLVG